MNEEECPRAPTEDIVYLKEIRWLWRSDEGAARCRNHLFPICGDSGFALGLRLPGMCQPLTGRAWVDGFHMPSCQLLPAPTVGSLQPQAESPCGSLARASQSSCTFLGDHHTRRKDGGGFCFHNATYFSKQVILPTMTW